MRQNFVVLGVIILIAWTLTSLLSHAYGCSPLTDLSAQSSHCKTPITDEFKEFGLDQYPFWIALTGYERSALHWDQFVRVYINQGTNVYQWNYLQFLREYLQDYDEDPPQIDYQKYPEGTVIAKENYAAEHGLPTQLLTLTVMVKRAKNYYAKGGNWEYIQFSSKGKVMLRGSGQNPQVQKACASCHQNVAQRDFIFSTMLTAVSNE